MAAIVPFAPVDQVAVGQQHRVTRPIGHQGDGKLGQHIWTVRIVGDLAKAFRLALGAKVAAGLVEPFQGEVGLGMNSGAQGQGKGLGRVQQGQGSLIQPVLVLLQRPPVQGQGQQFQFHPIQHQGPVSGTYHPQAGIHPGALLAQVETQFHLLDTIAQGGIVLAMDGLGLLGLAHVYRFPLLKGPLLARLDWDR